MSRTTLKPGDLVMVDPAQSNIQAGPAQVAENGTDLMFQWNPRPWHTQSFGGVQGLTAQQAEEVLRGEREFPWLLYKVWDEESQHSYAPPEWVLEEIDRRQQAVEAKSEPAANLGKIKPQPLDFETPKGGMW